MKIKITDKQLTECFVEVFEATEVCPCGEFIVESLTPTDKNDVKSIVKKEIKDFLEINRNSDFEKKVEDIIKKKFSKDKDIEKYIVDVTKNVLIQLYKTLWTKRSFWSNDLKNSSN